jgi:hypothetical protein
MSKTREIDTKVRDLRSGDVVIHEGVRNIIHRNMRQASGFYTLQLQVPGSPVKTFRDADPDFTFTRIGY